MTAYAVTIAPASISAINATMRNRMRRRLCKRVCSGNTDVPSRVTGICGVATHRRVQSRGGHRARRFAGKRLMARQHLVCDGGECVDVGASVDVRPGDLLRCDVGDGSQAAFGGEVRGVGAEGFGDAEVDDLYFPGRRQENVLRLHVPVDDALRVCVIKRRRDAARDVPRGLRVEMPEAFQERPECGAAGELHHDVEGPGVLAAVVDGHDVGVGQAGDARRFSSEALDQLFVVRERGVEDLDGDVPREQLVTCAVDGGHAAVPQTFLDEVPGAEAYADTRVRPDVDVAHATVRMFLMMGLANVNARCGETSPL
jgi:hypothetical protein